ncbi:unnamed protein product [Prorocentrum cordatum]|uniref:Subtilisin n=1 Tax=Prorocentrum cordatum TaxID=2364126 RepID=A0ABN9UKR1_9DINO|nr:unnamed protein product [Polarella glacialis]
MCVACQSASEGQAGCALVLFRDDPAVNADGQVSHLAGRISCDSIANALPLHGAGCDRWGEALEDEEAEEGLVQRAAGYDWRSQRRWLRLGARGDDSTIGKCPRRLRVRRYF